MGLREMRGEAGGTVIVREKRMGRADAVTLRARQFATEGRAGGVKDYYGRLQNMGSWFVHEQAHGAFTLRTASCLFRLTSGSICLELSANQMPLLRLQRHSCASAPGSTPVWYGSRLCMTATLSQPRSHILPAPNNALSLTAATALNVL
eukprot:IDg18656t1